MFEADPRGTSHGQKFFIIFTLFLEKNLHNFFSYEQKYNSPKYNLKRTDLHHIFPDQLYDMVAVVVSFFSIILYGIVIEDVSHTHIHILLWPDNL